ncbi:hypothetical protein VWM73_12845, partial [Campylobacter coli]
SFEAAKKDVAKDYALAQLKNIANAKFLELKEGKDKFQKDENIKELLKILLNKQKETIEGLGLADSFLFWCFSKSHLLRCNDL